MLSHYVSTLSLDWETRSTVSLPDTGAYVYAMHPDTDILLGAWAFDDEEPVLWYPGEPVPTRVYAHLTCGGIIRAHNASFERLMMKYVATSRHDWPECALEQFVCSAAEAAAMGLPRSLGGAAAATGITAQKDTEGHNLMMRMCRPRKINPDGSLVWWDNVKEKMDRLGAYCVQDVKTEQALTKVLRRLSPHEIAMYQLDQRINDRGVAIDIELVRAAQGIADTGIERANALMDELTGGEVSSVTNHGRLRAWLLAEGVETDSVGKAAIAALMETELTPTVREVLRVRADAGRSSIAKLTKMLQCACDDGRARGLFLFNAASTGRWGGRQIQPQNFPRGEVPYVEHYIPDVLAGSYDRIDLTAHPIVVVLSMLRAMLVGGEGRTLVAGDFKSIEACVLNWLAGQDDVCASFREYFAGDKSKDPYVIMAARMGEGTTRQAGKAAELGFGFGMGEAKFVSAAWAVYQVRTTIEDGAKAKYAYRDSHRMVEHFWSETNTACMRAIETPGIPQWFGARNNLRAIVAGAYLYIILPSGRMLCYAAPCIKDGMTPWGEMKPGIEYSGVDSYTNQWSRQRTYGGHLVENIVQAVARDLLAAAMQRLEEAGFPVVLHSHDEIVCELRNESGIDYVSDLEAVMASSPAWAEGCPVAVEGWQSKRYRK